ncbi:protein kinase [Chloroflexales bacterium ZM16-3]|nr:protein kinase [Chloroflexales bacterium ZM16-3]
MTELIGTSFGGMRLEQEIGRGSRARVFLGRNTVRGQTAAIKVFAPAYSGDAIFQRLLSDYAMQVSSIRDAYLVAVQSAGVEQGHAYLVQDYASGGTLRSRLRQSETLLLERLTIAWQCALGLAKLHQYGLMHGDITSSNILLDSRPSPSPSTSATLAARLSDYGIALLRSTTEGDAAYIAPERWRQNQMSTSADIYAFGVVLYELCAGRVPFHTGTRMEAAQKHHSEPPPPIRMFAPDIPTSIEAIIGCCLEKDPLLRYASAELLADALSSAIGPLHPPAPKTIPTPPVLPQPVAPPPNLRVRLESATGQPLGKWQIGLADLRVGREPDNEIRLPPHDTLISRYHLRIHWDGGQIIVEDLGSGNGTVLRGQRLSPKQPASWHVGDEVHVGAYRLLLETPQPPAPPPPTIVSAPSPPIPTAQPKTHQGNRWAGWAVAALGFGALGLATAAAGTTQGLIAFVGVLLLVFAAVLLFRPVP